MSRYEVTNGQYCEFLNSALGNNSIYLSGDSVYGSDNDLRYCNTSANSISLIVYTEGLFSVQQKSGYDMSEDPVIAVSWYGAAAYCNWRSQQGGIRILL